MWGHFTRGKKAAGPDVGDRAPEISLPTMDGGKFTLSESAKRAPVILAFFKVSCSTCQFTFPFLERLHRAYRGEGAEFRGISQDDARRSREFADKFGITFPFAIDDPSYAASKGYRFSNVPTILLVEREGTIRFRGSGFSRAGLIELSEKIGGMLGRLPEAVFLPHESVPELKPG